LLSSLIAICPAFAQQPVPDSDDAGEIPAASPHQQAGPEHDDAGEMPAASPPQQAGPEHDGAGQGPAASPGQTAALEVPDTEPGASRAHERMLTLNPSALLIGSLDAEYEQALSPSLSGFLGPYIAYARIVDTSALALGVLGGIRYFFLESRSPAGLWAGPQAVLGYVTVTRGDTSATGAILSLGGLLGYTWLFDSGFVASLGGGIQFTYATVAAQGDAVDLRGYGPALRLAIGWSF
jgi:hypothetical protein